MGLRMLFSHGTAMLAGIIIAATLSLAFAWTGPTQAPPNGNVSAPVNVGTVNQVKNAGLSVNTLSVFGNGILTGNLGVGTTAPAAGYRLDVNAGSARISNPGGSSFIELGNGQTANNYAYIDLVGDTTYPDYGLRLIRGNAGANAVSQLVSRGTGTFSIGAQDAGLLSFLTSNIARLSIGSTGNVGIGTTSPNAKLHVAGTAGVDGIRFPDGTLQTTAAGASSNMLTSVIQTTAARNGNFASIPGAQNGFHGMQLFAEANGCSGYRVCQATDLAQWQILGNTEFGTDGWVPDGRDTGGNERSCSRWGSSSSNEQGALWYEATNFSAPLGVYVTGVQTCNVSKKLYCCR